MAVRTQKSDPFKKQVAELFKIFKETDRRLNKQWQETDKKMQETNRQMQETDKKIKELSFLFTGQWAN